MNQNSETIDCCMAAVWNLRGRRSAAVRRGSQTEGVRQRESDRGSQTELTKGQGRATSEPNLKCISFQSRVRSRSRLSASHLNHGCVPYLECISAQSRLVGSLAEAVALIKVLGRQRRTHEAGHGERSADRAQVDVRHVGVLALLEREPLWRQREDRACKDSTRGIGTQSDKWLRT